MCSKYFVSQLGSGKIRTCLTQKFRACPSAQTKNFSKSFYAPICKNWSFFLDRPLYHRERREIQELEEKIADYLDVNREIYLNEIDISDNPLATYIAHQENIYGKNFACI